MAENTIVNNVCKDVASSLSFEKLLKKVININIYRKILMTTYNRWNKESKEVENILGNIEEALKSYSYYTTAIKIGGQACTVLGGIAEIIALILNNPEIARSFRRVGTGMQVTGAVAEAGSNVANKILSKSYCDEAKNKVNSFMELTQELEKQKDEYFSLLKEYVELLDKLSEAERRKFSSYIEEEDLKILQSDVDLDSRVQKKIPPIVQKMQQLKLKEDALNVTIIEFSLFPKIAEELKSNPVLKDILAMKSESIPCLNGENALKAVKMANHVQTFVSFSSLFSSKFQEIKKFSFATKSTNILLLLGKSGDLIYTYSTLGEISIQCKEIGRVKKEFKQYRLDTEAILNDALKWACCEDYS